MDYSHDRRRGIDLHIHSTASDGSLTPEQIIDQAAKAKLAAISITDHDTLAGIRQVSTTDLPAGLHVLSGIEISVLPPPSFPIAGSLHLLGYGIHLADPALNRALSKQKTSRDARIPAIIAKLNASGLAISTAEVYDLAGDGQVGRAHVAVCMVQKGYAVDTDDAFDRFLGHGKPAYVARYRIATAEAIALVRSAGGIPILAHPALYDLDDFDQLRALIDTLIRNGLMGIEVYYPGQEAQFVDRLMRLSHELNLLITGGTDFHGAMKPSIQIGIGAGDLRVPFSLYEKLMAHIDPERRKGRLVV